jgi:hypothetical protein
MKLHQTDRGVDPEANEWTEALNQVIESSGVDGPVPLLDQLSD